MEAYFDNKGNILNAHICIPRDHSVLYTVETTFDLMGRKVTVLKDENPVFEEAIVGRIYWKQKLFEVRGTVRQIASIKRTEGRFMKKVHYWRWVDPERRRERKEYCIKYKHREGWKVTSGDNTLAQFSAPNRPRLFGKTDPPTFSTEKTLHTDEEVFLILLFIYNEVKRQDVSGTASVNGNVGW